MNAIDSGYRAKFTPEFWQRQGSAADKNHEETKRAKKRKNLRSLRGFYRQSG
jgi:hypothetical protein